MRWIYLNDNPEEAAEREAIVAKIDAWWRAFERKIDDLRALFKGKARGAYPSGWTTTSTQSTPRSCGSTGRRSVLTGTGWS